jgi:hypothetical protein
MGWWDMGWNSPTIGFIWDLYGIYMGFTYMGVMDLSSGKFFLVCNGK